MTSCNDNMLMEAFYTQYTTVDSISLKELCSVTLSLLLSIIILVSQAFVSLPFLKGLKSAGLHFLKGKEEDPLNSMCTVDRSENKKYTMFWG